MALRNLRWLFRKPRVEEFTQMTLAKLKKASEAARSSGLEKQVSKKGWLGAFVARKRGTP